MSEKFLQSTVINAYSCNPVLNAYKEFSEKGFLPQEKNLIEQYFRKPGRLIDIGCGGGRTAKLFSGMGYDTYGLELVKPMIGIAEKYTSGIKNRPAFIQGNAVSIPFESNSFDYAFVGYNSWEHIPFNRNRQLFFHETARVMKPDGLLYISFHSRNRWFINLRQLFEQIKNYLSLKKNYGAEFGDRILSGFSKIDKGEYTNIYLHVSSPGEVKKHLVNNGFEIIDAILFKKDVKLKKTVINNIICDNCSCVAKLKYK